MPQIVYAARPAEFLQLIVCSSRFQPLQPLVFRHNRAFKIAPDSAFKPDSTSVPSRRMRLLENVMTDFDIANVMQKRVMLLFYEEEICSIYLTCCPINTGNDRDCNEDKNVLNDHFTPWRV